MKKDIIPPFLIEDHVGCFGEFDGRDRICTVHCALRLRCTIEKEQNIRMEIIEELVSAERPLTKLQ